MLKPNVIVMFLVVAAISAAAMFLIADVANEPAVAVAGILAVVTGIVGVAGATIKELVAPSKSDVQILLEHEQEMAELNKPVSE